MLFKDQLDYLVDDGAWRRQTKDGIELCDIEKVYDFQLFLLYRYKTTVMFLTVGRKL